MNKKLNDRYYFVYRNVCDKQLKTFLIVLNIKV